MIRTAVILTVHNRKEITLQGLRSLYTAIEVLGTGYIFDVFMTDDGCTDGTGEAVAAEFPDIHIIKGDGSLFWGGGMRLAWNAAIESDVDYDYYLWFNDDSELYDSALKEILDGPSDDCIVTGAFCDSNHKPSYGGRNRNDQILEPNGATQEVYMMNGNLVLVPPTIYAAIGNITPHLLHGGGDFDYGFRAQKAGYKVLLTKAYVGVADRHDEFIPKYCNKELGFKKRWDIMHNPVYSPYEYLKYNIRHHGFFTAIKSYLICYIGVLLPAVYVKLKGLNKKK
jgi:GT2 family glycosyltransferase